jgi:transcriptional regulator with XRE-family HTH domain
MTIFLAHVLNELEAGHEGPEIPEAKRVYFQRRVRDRFFDFLRERFEREESNGLTQAKLARRIGRSPEVINRWLNAPSNLTLDSISDLMIGVAAEEPEFDGISLLNRPESNYTHLAEQADNDNKLLNAARTAPHANEERKSPLLGKPQQRYNQPENDYLKQLVTG